MIIYPHNTNTQKY